MKIFALIYADFEDAGMEFEIDIPEEVVSVSVDSIQFSRVITNLLNNAMKHNESGTHIKIGMYRKNGYIYILVADMAGEFRASLRNIYLNHLQKEMYPEKWKWKRTRTFDCKKIIEMHGFQMDFIQQLDEKKFRRLQAIQKNLSSRSRTTATTHPSRHDESGAIKESARI